MSSNPRVVVVQQTAKECELFRIRQRNDLYEVCKLSTECLNTLLKEFRQARSFVKNWLEKLATARIHPRYDCLKDSGRTGSSGPNIQASRYVAAAAPVNWARR